MGYLANYRIIVQFLYIGQNIKQIKILTRFILYICLKQDDNLRYPELYESRLVTLARLYECVAHVSTKEFFFSSNFFSKNILNQT